MNKAILFLIFNRLDTAQKVFEQIKAIKPKYLYVASDGPRENVDGEAKKVNEVRNYIINNIDWDCEIHTLFRDTNLGCGVAIYKAITWFFENEEDGIILEDDCVPCQSFFYFCEELLNKYKDNQSIWQISGNGYYKDKKAKSSYYFSKIPQCWGWATWADRWKNFKFDVSDFSKKDFELFSSKKEVQKYWQGILKYIENGKKDIWDYNWVFTVVSNKGFCIDPYNHLVTNVGVNGTHFNGNDPLLNVEIEEIKNIVHPNVIQYNNKAIDYIYKNMFHIKERSLFSYVIDKQKIGNKRIITILGCIKLSYKKRGKDA